MNRENLISCIQLINTPGIGPIGFRKLLRQFGSAENALSALSRKKEVFSRRKAEEEIMTAELKHVEIITAEDEAYPYNLKQIEDFPPILYAKGNIELLKNDNMLAVVGSRSASLSALKLAGRIAADIARKDVVVVSGMARGIDAAAHQGALEADGGTIAVLGTGIDVVYPLENEKLYNKLVQNGLVLTEYPFHTKPQATNFPRRNRIVSGLSKGVLVIEAGVRSGSLITAHQALEQGRDVYAVPGAPYDGRASGCNKLLKEGAIWWMMPTMCWIILIFLRLHLRRAMSKNPKPPICLNIRLTIRKIIPIFLNKAATNIQNCCHWFLPAGKMLTSLSGQWGCRRKKF